MFGLGVAFAASQSREPSDAAGRAGASVRTSGTPDGSPTAMANAPASGQPSAAPATNTPDQGCPTTEGVIVTCAANPYDDTEVAGVAIGPHPDMRRYLFEGELSELATPPAYDPTHSTYHCLDWADWIQQNRLYAPWAILVLLAPSGSSATARLVDLKVQILSKRRMGATTEIGCGNFDFGLGPGPGATVDLRTGKATARAKDSSPDTPMPPASLAFDANSRTIVIDVSGGDQGFAYEGILTVSLVVDGVRRDIVLGSTTAPYRWVADGRGSPGVGAWDWNPTTKRWTTELSRELPVQ